MCFYNYLGPADYFSPPLGLFLTYGVDALDSRDQCFSLEVATDLEVEEQEVFSVHFGSEVDVFIILGAVQRADIFIVDTTRKSVISKGVMVEGMQP